MKINLRRLIAPVLSGFFATTTVLCSCAAEPERLSLPPTCGDSVSAVLTVYLAPHSSGKAIVVCPGGAYANRAVKHEGTDWVQWMNDRGITMALLEYRLPAGRSEVPGDDARNAIRTMRERAAQYGIDKVGVMGFSAGGHLASTAATHYDASSRPDFQILFYPVISMQPELTHWYSRTNLLGETPDEATVALYSNELQVTPDTPEAIIFHSGNDNVVSVDNALAYYNALRHAGVAASLHIVPTGGHGWGLYDFDYKPLWDAALTQWLEKR